MGGREGCPWDGRGAVGISQQEAVSSRVASGWTLYCRVKAWITHSSPSFPDLVRIPFELLLDYSGVKAPAPPPVHHESSLPLG